MKKNAYEVEKNVEKVLRGGSSGFLTVNVVDAVRKRLKSNDYSVFSPYDEAEKIILYGNRCPSIFLVRICCYEKEKICHSAILGSLFGLNISSEMFGDIVCYDGDFYVYFLESVREFIFCNFWMVGNIPIKLEEVDLDFLCDFQREYEINEVIVSSLRIDTVLARLIGCNRDKVKGKILDKQVMVNGVILNKVSYVLMDGDVFSVRKCGKYRCGGVNGMTKKGNYVVIVKRYI